MKSNLKTTPQKQGEPFAFFDLAGSFVEQVVNLTL